MKEIFVLTADQAMAFSIELQKAVAQSNTVIVDQRAGCPVVSARVTVNGGECRKHLLPSLVGTERITK